jgi:hypothetical protein
LSIERGGIDHDKTTEYGCKNEEASHGSTICGPRLQSFKAKAQIRGDFSFLTSLAPVPSAPTGDGRRLPKWNIPNCARLDHATRLARRNPPCPLLIPRRLLQPFANAEAQAASAWKEEYPMTTRRHFVAASAVLASSLATLKPALAQSDKDAPKVADFLFVQTAEGLRFHKDTNKLTLVDVSPITLFFADRPERIAGNMKTSAFIPFWSEGKDSFKNDPPNADVSILSRGKLEQIVVVLQDPVLEDDDLTYTVRVLEGELPAKAKDVSLFIDIIGMPWTPLSYAGVARRTYRRAYFWR